MGNFEVIKKIKSEKELTTNEVISEIKSSLGKSLNYSVISETANSITISGVEKGAPYKFNATFKVNVEGDKAKIAVHGEQKVTTFFLIALCCCVLFCWTLLPLIALIVGIIRLNTNKDMYTKKVGEILDNVNAQIAW